MAIGSDCGTCARQRRRRRRSKIAMHKGIRIGSGWGSSLVYDSSRSRRRCERHWPKLKCPVESISHLRRGRRIASLILSCSLSLSLCLSFLPAGPCANYVWRMCPLCLAVDYHTLHNGFLHQQTRWQTCANSLYSLPFFAVYSPSILFAHLLRILCLC